MIYKNDYIHKIDLYYKNGHCIRYKRKKNINGLYIHIIIILKYEHHVVLNCWNV